MVPRICNNRSQDLVADVDEGVPVLGVAVPNMLGLSVPAKAMLTTRTMVQTGLLFSSFFHPKPQQVDSWNHHYKHYITTDYPHHKHAS